MTQITDEMKVAAVKAYTDVDGKCRPAAMQKALEAALPFLPIAVEGKVKALQGPFHVSRTSDGKDHWFSARDAASGISIPGKSRENARALVASLNRAFDLHLRLALASSPGNTPEGWQLVPVKMDVGMIGAWYRYKNGWHSHDEEPPRDTSDVGAWSALLAAAPIPPSSPGKDGGQEVEETK